MKILECPSTEIHIWSYSITPAPSKVQFYRNYLCKEELERSGLFYNDDLKNKFVLARGGLKDILTHYVSVNHPRELKFKHLKYGKPILEPRQNPQNLFFNLSHSNNIASLIISNISPVGIDIEFIRPFDNMHDVAKSVFTPCEYDEMLCKNKQVETLNFYRIWTMKEAIVKSLGVGLNCPFNQFAVSGVQDKILMLKYIKWKDESIKNWLIGNVNVAENYIGSYALKTSLPISTKAYQLSGPLDPVCKTR